MHCNVCMRACQRSLCNPFSCRICEKDTLFLAFFVENMLFFLQILKKMYPFMNKIAEKWCIALEIFKNCRRVIHPLLKNAPFLLHLCPKSISFLLHFLGKSQPWCCHTHGTAYIVSAPSGWWMLSHIFIYLPAMQSIRILNWWYLSLVEGMVTHWAQYTQYSHSITRNRTQISPTSFVPPASCFGSGDWGWCFAREDESVVATIRYKKASIQ